MGRPRPGTRPGLGPQALACPALPHSVHPALIRPDPAPDRAHGREGGLAQLAWAAPGNRARRPRAPAAGRGEHRRRRAPDTSAGRCSPDARAVPRAHRRRTAAARRASRGACHQTSLPVNLPCRTLHVDQFGGRYRQHGFPGESAAARDQLLEQEIELRRAIEAATAARRALPPGGVIPEDYIFQGAGSDGAAIDVRLSEVFVPGKDSLIIYSGQPSISRSWRGRRCHGS
ncbi:DUF899 family protein [Streptomyces sp. LZ34]